MNGDRATPLLATQRIITTPMPRPVVIVGLPRSGTSLLSDILSQMPEYFVFDDLYLYRNAMGMGATGILTPDQLDKLIFFLGWQIRARIKHGVFDSTRTTISLEMVDQMDEALRATFQGGSIRWHDLMMEWIGRLALHHGASRWGFKAPQDFLNIDTYVKLFPDVRFVFLCRDPRRVMASLKHVRSQDGDPRQYHPAVYARYWRMASETVARAQLRYEGRILSVRFEDLIQRPQAQAEAIAEFLGSHIGPVTMAKTNSSFAPGQAPARLTPTETWICEKLAGQAMRQHDYPAENPAFRTRDLPDLLATTLRFSLYQAHRMVFDPAGRHSARQFLRRLLRTRGT